MRKTGLAALVLLIATTVPSLGQPAPFLAAFCDDATGVLTGSKLTDSNYGIIDCQLIITNLPVGGDVIFSGEWHYPGYDVHDIHLWNQAEQVYVPWSTVSPPWAFDNAQLGGYYGTDGTRVFDGLVDNVEDTVTNGADEYTFWQRDGELNGIGIHLDGTAYFGQLGWVRDVKRGWLRAYRQYKVYAELVDGVGDTIAGTKTHLFTLRDNENDWINPYPNGLAPNVPDGGSPLQFSTTSVCPHYTEAVGKSKVRVVIAWPTTARYAGGGCIDPYDGSIHSYIRDVYWEDFTWPSGTVPVTTTTTTTVPPLDCYSAWYHMPKVKHGQSVTVSCDDGVLSH